MAYLEHYGTPRHSGRYPWGSGKNPQRSQNILTRAQELKDQGLSPVQIANAFGMSTTDYRAMYKIASENVKADAMRRCNELKDKGYSLAAISRTTGLPWSTVKNYLDPTKQMRVDKTTKHAAALKEELENKPYLDIGEGVERQMNISDVQLKTAVSMLQQQGYGVHVFRVEQPSNPQQKTTIKVLTKPGVEKSEVWANREKIASYSGPTFEDYGTVRRSKDPVISVDPKRVHINYTDDGSGGGEKDGVMEIRPGVEDLSLGNRRYAQVRIAVNDSHYLKGMAIYGDPKKMPKGVDIVFNTNKHKDVPMIGPKDNTVLKPLKDDPVNPFGSSVKAPEHYIGKDGKDHVSPIHIVNDDEDWAKWKKSLSSQFLSKQRPALAKQQLDIDYDKRKKELNDITLLTNPTVKRKLLETYAETADKAAVHLKAAAVPRQAAYAILPVPSLKDNEVYAPNYEEGEEVILVRHPHQGTFEIPRLKVVTKNKDAIAALGEHPAHAIGINSHVAQQMSGADFDGDTVLVIPTKGLKVKAGDTETSKSLYNLRYFDPIETYPNDPSKPETGSKGEGFNKGKEMGSISNLITDMTLIGCDPEELARAVRHSLVVIDAEKHNLDWRASERDNGIAQLKARYQGGAKNGAATLISRAKGEIRVDEVKELVSPKLPDKVREDWQQGKINIIANGKNIESLDEIQKLWDSGVKIYRETGRTYNKQKQIVDPDDMTDDELELYNSGKKVYRDTGKYPKYQSKFEKLAWLDPEDLSSGTRMELVYANYSRDVKGLADQARAELRRTGRLKFNQTAKDTYKDEVRSLEEKLNAAALNAPLERQATLIADSNIKAKIQADPSLKDKDNKDKLKKLRSKEMENARALVGAARQPIDITEKEWEAIEAGAISDTRLEQILRYADLDKVRALATPYNDRGLPANVKARARMLLLQGYAPSTVAKEIGVSVSTLSKEFENFNKISED